MAPTRRITNGGVGKDPNHVRPPLSLFSRCRSRGRKAPPTAAWKTRERVFHKRPHRFLISRNRGQRPRRGRTQGRADRRQRAVHRAARLPLTGVRARRPAERRRAASIRALRSKCARTPCSELIEAASMHTCGSQWTEGCGPADFRARCGSGRDKNRRKPTPPLIGIPLAAARRAS